MQETEELKGQRCANLAPLRREHKFPAFRYEYLGRELSDWIDVTSGCPHIDRNATEGLIPL